jgi:UDPglucose 6-dehydrogenase
MVNEQLTVKVAQIGAGVVGTAAGKGLRSKCFDVTFVDIDPAAITRLRAEGHKAVSWEEFDGSDTGIFLVSVPTYRLGDLGDTGPIMDVSKRLGRIIREKDEYCVVALRSSVLPGTTEGMVIPLLEEYSGKTAGRDFGVCFNPEYLREKTAAADFLDAPLVLIGEYDRRSGRFLNKIYDWVDCPVHYVDLRTAEMQKFVHNVFNSAKISFFNEVREICEVEGIDADAVFPYVCLSAEGMWNPAYGTKDYGPFDGMCLPKDTKAFLSYGKRIVGDLKMVQATLDVNLQLEDALMRKVRSA